MTYTKIKETDDWTEYEHKSYNGGIQKVRHKKFAVLNGPLASTYATEIDVEPCLNYVRYINSGSSRSYMGIRGISAPRNVWIMFGPGGFE